MNIQLCAQTTEEFLALVAASNLALVEPNKAKLGSGFYLTNDGVHTFLINERVIR